MLGAFSVGHLRGNGGRIPEAQHVPGGLLGADYTIKNNRYCIAKIYTGGKFNPQRQGAARAARAEREGGRLHPRHQRAGPRLPLPTSSSRSKAPPATSSACASPRPTARIRAISPSFPSPAKRPCATSTGSKATSSKVDKLSGGKLAYVYLPDTGAGGFTNFNRYYFAQTDKQGAVIDERFNAGGQVADYFVEVLGRHIESYWSPRYGTIEHTPNAGIYGPKVMIANEFSGSGGDALPWLFKQAKLGPLVGKRTWGGLVGIGGIPVLMDGGERYLAERRVLLAQGRMGRREPRRRSRRSGRAGPESSQRRPRSRSWRRQCPSPLEQHPIRNRNGVS